jgi:prevent-host-death family protein
VGYVNMLDAKTNLSKLVEQVESGAAKEIVIARNGKPAAKLVPVGVITPKGKRLGVAAGLYPDFDLEDFNRMDAEIAAMFDLNQPLDP